MNEDIDKVLEEFEDRLRSIDCEHFGECYIVGYDVAEEKKWLKQLLINLFNKYE